jgi:ubiquinol-cytochrome c reductase iron-sulfur subunit
MATVEHTEGSAAEASDGYRRRDFINIAAVSAAGVGAASLLYPLVNQMNPSADVLALASIDVDISSIQPGQAIKTIWRKQPIFIRNLTPQEQAAANAVPVGELRDPQTLADRTAEGKTNWLISRLRPAGCGRRRESRRIWRLFLPLPRFTLRHCRPNSQRSGAAQSRSAGI